MVGSPSGYQAAVSNGVPLGRNERSRPPRFSQHWFLQHPNSRFYLGEAEAPRGLRRKKTKNGKAQKSTYLKNIRSTRTFYSLTDSGAAGGACGAACGAAEADAHDLFISSGGGGRF